MINRPIHHRFITDLFTDLPNKSADLSNKSVINWPIHHRFIYRRRNLRSGLRKMQSTSHMIFYGQKLLFFHIWTFINFYLWTSAVLGHFLKVTKLEKWEKSLLFLNKVQNHTFFKFFKIILNVMILTQNSVDILYIPLTFV